MLKMKKTKMTASILFVLLGLTCLMVDPAGAGEPAFALKPQASKEGSGLRIKFAVTVPCSVEVAVLAADGKEVRHLAAGMLGSKTAAEPLKANNLQQSLLWDRKDDWGRPLTGKAFSIRVRLGMKAAGAKPILKAKSDGPKPYKIAKVIIDPDPSDAGRAGLTSSELSSKEGKRLWQVWRHSWHLMADREDDRIYATHQSYRTATYRPGSWYRYLGATDKVTPLDLSEILKPGDDFKIGPNGEINVNPLRKFTRDFKKIPPLLNVPQRKKCNRFSMTLWCRWRAGPFVEHWRTGNRSPEYGLDGRCYMYICLSKPVAYFCVFDTWEKKRALREGFQPWLLRSGKTASGGHFACFRVDTKGKVYIATGGTPKGVAAPKKYGSIIKLNLDDRWIDAFSLPMGAAPKDPEELKKGIEWKRGNFTPRIEKCYSGIMSWLVTGCACTVGTIFDLDEYGRLYIPDAGRESVVVLDNEGNEILRLKKTVSAGAQGQDRPIHVGWPHRVAATRKAIYFGEGLSRRVIRVKLGYAAQATCKVP
jgi:hypothetical protein